MKYSNSSGRASARDPQSSTLAARWRRARRWRTPLIALVSLAVLLFGAVETWGVDPAELIGYLVASLIGLAIVIVGAFLFSLLLRWLRRGR